MANKMTTVWQQASAEDVVAFFVAAYERKPKDYAWYFDPSKGTFIFRLYVEEPANGTD